MHSVHWKQCHLFDMSFKNIGRTDTALLGDTHSIQIQSLSFPESSHFIVGQASIKYKWTENYITRTELAVTRFQHSSHSHHGQFSNSCLMTHFCAVTNQDSSHSHHGQFPNICLMTLFCDLTSQQSSHSYHVKFWTLCLVTLFCVVTSQQSSHS